MCQPQFETCGCICHPKVELEVIKQPDTPMGIPNGKTIYHVQAIEPWKIPNASKLLGSGCVLGREYTEDGAVRDFVRRAQGDGGIVQLNDVTVTRRIER